MNTSFSLEEFVEVWQSSPNLATICSRLKISNKHRATKKAWQLRKLGVKLKNFNKLPKEFSVERVAKLKKLAEGSL